MAFSHKYNTDDVLIRATIVGLLKELNNTISYTNVWADDKTQEVRVPFYYAMSGDERFLQDYFSNWNDCIPDFIEGNTDPIPRGTLFLSGVSILSGNLTSRYVRGYYHQEVDGELKRFNSYINSIPIQLNFSAEILVDTVLDSFKIMQSIMTTLYKTVAYSVNYAGFRVPIQAGFPENLETTKLFEYTYNTDQRIKVTFAIEVQSYLPIPDEKQKMFAGNYIESANINVGITGATSGLIMLNPLYPSIDPLHNGPNPSNQSIEKFNMEDDSGLSEFSGNYWE